MKNTNVPIHLQIVSADKALVINSEYRKVLGIGLVYNKADFDTVAKYDREGKLLKGSSAYSFVLGRESKEAVGLFRSSFYWGCIANMMATMTPEDLIILAHIILASKVSSITEVEKTFVQSSLTQYVNSNFGSREMMDLMIRVLYTCYWGFEEALMDASKTKPRVMPDGTVVDSPEDPLTAEEIISNVVSGKNLDWKYLELSGIETCVLKFVVSRGKFSDTQDALIRQLLVQKRKWQSDQNSWKITQEMLSNDILDYSTSLTIPKVAKVLERELLPLQDLAKGVDIQEAIEWVNLLPLPEGTSVPLGRQVDYTVTLMEGGINYLSQKEFGFCVGISKNSEGHYFLTTQSGEKLDSQSFVALSSIEKCQGKTFADLPENNLFGEIVTRDTGAVRFYGPRVVAWEHLHGTDMNGRLYPKTSGLNVYAMSFQTWLAYEAHQWCIKSQVFDAANLNPQQIALLGKSLRSLVSGIQKCPDTESGILYMNEFIFPVVPECKLKKEALRHLFLTVEKCGYDLSCTGHGSKGEKVGRKLTNGNVQTYLEPFGQVGHTGRYTKTDSTNILKLMFDKVRPGQYGRINPNDVTSGTQTTVCVASVYSISRFGAGSPGDETSITPDGVIEMSTSKIVWSLVTEDKMDEFNLIQSQYPEGEGVQWKIGAEVPVGINLNPSHPMFGAEILTQSYYLAESVSGGQNQYFKTILGSRGGSVSTPVKERYLATYKPVESGTLLASLTETEYKIVHILDSAIAHQKKGWTPGVLQMGWSHLSVQSQSDILATMGTESINNLTSNQIIDPIRSTSAFKKESVVLEKPDFVSLLQESLEAEGKDRDGFMYLYEIMDITEYLVPVLDTDGNPAMCLAGDVVVMKARYDGTMGSYNTVRVGKNSMDPFIMAMVGETLEVSPKAQEDWFYAQVNKAGFDNWTSPEKLRVKKAWKSK